MENYILTIPMNQYVYYKGDDVFECREEDIDRVLREVSR
jgi:hypothetical protein